MINVFLDLEETVIDDWFSGIFLNYKIDIIKSKIEKFSIEYQKEIAQDKNINLILFSAAVCNNEDLKKYELEFKDMLEEKLGFTFNSEFLFSDKSIFSLARGRGIRHLPDDTIHDIFQFNIKEEIFNLVAVKNEINILFDDTVKDKIVFEDLNFHNTDNAKTIKIFCHC